jgi:hypothetical protein
MPELPPAFSITAAEMQERFNKGKYWERMLRGEFAAVVIGRRKPRAELAAIEPIGTISQMISYRDANDDEVARVHQYTRPDGTIGASGRPDPKRLFEDGILYRLMKKAKPAV